MVYDATLVGKAVLFVAFSVNKDELVPKHPSAAVNELNAYGQLIVSNPPLV